MGQNMSECFHTSRAQDCALLAVANDYGGETDILKGYWQTFKASKLCLYDVAMHITG